MSLLSLPFAEAVPILLPAYEELHLVLIGCGGTGGWLAVNLPRIAYLQKQAGKKVAITFIDPDRVESKNIPRQNFIPSDLGLPKASVNCISIIIPINISNQELVLDLPAIQPIRRKS